MAKSKSFFGLRRGSTKTLTFQVNNGKQITKDRVYEVKNPRTQEQMVQRMVMATASAAYAGMKQIVDHSFEGITYGQMNMSEFIRVNAKKLRENLGAANPVMCFNKYQDRSLVPGAYIMSSGTASNFPVDPLVYSSEEVSATGLQVHLETAVGSAATTNKIAAKYGIGLNDLMTVCGIQFNSSKESWDFVFVRFTLLDLSDTALSAANIAEHIKIESNVAITTTPNNNQIDVKTAGTDTDQAGVAFCVIHSVKTANGWTRNNTVLDISGIEAQFMNPTEEDAIATYPIGGSYVLNGGEVNG
ncbi:hypothetical protein ACQCP7_24000 [Ralstonia pseudosolanacearum]|uniref:hypothetical protein n=1 Tax=Ralstonia pseudosolanacearum TaxID=1310165 RepID=UPI003CF169DF|nr:hypothetical protein [Bacteroidales bacterium]